MRGVRRVLLVGAMLLASSFPARAETVSQTLERADRYWSAGQLDQAQQAFEAAVNETTKKSMANMKKLILQFWAELAKEDI